MDSEVRNGVKVESLDMGMGLWGVVVVAVSSVCDGQWCSMHVNSIAKGGDGTNKG